MDRLVTSPVTANVPRFTPSKSLARDLVGLKKPGCALDEFQSGKFFDYEKSIWRLFLVVIAIALEIYVLVTFNMSLGLSAAFVAFAIVFDLLVSVWKHSKNSELRILKAKHLLDSSPNEFTRNDFNKKVKILARTSTVGSLILFVFFLVKIAPLSFDLTGAFKYLSALLSQGFLIPLGVYAFALVVHQYFSGPIISQFRFQRKWNKEYQHYMDSNGNVGTRTIENTIFDTPLPLVEAKFGLAESPHRLVNDPNMPNRWRLEPNGIILDSEYPGLLNQQKNEQCKDLLYRQVLKSQLQSL